VKNASSAHDHLLFFDGRGIALHAKSAQAFASPARA
jgi:hypothetical protein